MIRLNRRAACGVMLRVMVRSLFFSTLLVATVLLAAGDLSAATRDGLPNTGDPGFRFEGKGAPELSTDFEKRRSEAIAGDAEAANLLGFLHARGRGVAQDYTKALRWYGLAAQRGHTEAQFNLALLHQFGLGTPPDPDKAIV